MRCQKWYKIEYNTCEHRSGDEKHGIKPHDEYVYNVTYTQSIREANKLMRTLPNPKMSIEQKWF